jgi:hypothetical protein
VTLFLYGNDVNAEQDHGELDASGARGKSEATEDRLIRLCSPKLAL